MTPSFVVGMLLGSTKKESGVSLEFGPPVGINAGRCGGYDHVSSLGGLGSCQISNFSGSGFDIKVDTSKFDSSVVGRGACNVFYKYKTSKGDWKWNGGFLDWMRRDNADNLRNHRSFHNWEGLGDLIADGLKDHKSVCEVRVYITDEWFKKGTSAGKV